MNLSYSEIEAIKCVAGWYDFNWYDANTKELVKYLDKWSNKKSSVYLTSRCLEYTRQVRKALPNEDKYDFSYDILRDAEDTFREHLFYLTK